MDKYELELGFWIGPGNNLAKPISIEAAQITSPVSLSHDWSARDIQAWSISLWTLSGQEFSTTISPWVVTAEALAPFVGSTAAT